MFCQKCGNEVIEDAVVCPSCGCAINKAEPPVDLTGKDKLNIGLLILSIVIPIVGVILWPVKHKTEPKSAKIYGIAGIAAWICYMLFLL